MSSKQITMSYDEYHADLSEAQAEGYRKARNLLQRLMKLSKDELEMQHYEYDERRGPESNILREIFEYFFMD